MTEGLTPRPLAELIREIRPLREADRLADAAARIADAGGGLPVVDPDGSLVGYLSERDLLQALFPAYLQQFRNTEFLTRDFPSLVRRARESADDAVGEHMRREPLALDEGDSESHAAELFIHHGVRSLPAVGEGGRVVGVVRLADLIRSLLEACGALPPARGDRAADPG